VARVLEEIGRIETTETEFRKRQQELSTTPLPRKKDLKRYQDQKLELATVNGQIEQAAIRIGFDLQAEDISIITEPDVERLTEDGEYLVLGRRSLRSAISERSLSGVVVHRLKNCRRRQNLSPPKLRHL